MKALIRFLSILFFLLIQILTYSTSNALVFGPTNFDLFGYPSHKCYKLSIPYNRDNMSIMLFEQELATYKRCIEEYVKGADNDMERISEESNKAVNEYNNFIRSIR